MRWVTRKKIERGLRSRHHMGKGPVGPELKGVKFSGKGK